MNAGTPWIGWKIPQNTGEGALADLRFSSTMHVDFAADSRIRCMRHTPQHILAPPVMYLHRTVGGAGCPAQTCIPSVQTGVNEQLQTDDSGTIDTSGDPAPDDPPVSQVCL